MNKKRKMLSRVRLLSLVLVLAALLSSCSFIVVGDEAEQPRDTAIETDGKDTETGAPDTEGTQTDKSPTASKDPTKDALEAAKKQLAELKDYDFGGQNFIIATTSNMTFATDSDEYYDRALYLRDSLVEEKYNIDIITIFSGEGNIEKEIKNALLSEDYFADLVSVPEYRVGKMAASGSIINLRSLPFYSPSPVYSAYTSESYAGDAIYADIGAASSDFSRAYAVFFNRDIAEQLGYDMDRIAAEGKWTWELFDAIAREATEKLGIAGQGSIKMGDEYTDVVFRSGGERLVRNKLGQTPRVYFNSRNTEELVELACSLIYGNPSALRGGEKNFFPAFSDGKLLFAIAPLYSMESFAACNVEWGVIPIPKLSEQQERYYAYTEATANVLAVPKGNNKYDVTGIIIGGLNAASYGLLASEYKMNCLYNYFRSEKALRSMDLVLSSLTFDFSFLYSSSAKKLADATYGAVREARKSATYTATELINLRMNEANAELEELFGKKDFDYGEETGEVTETESPQSSETVPASDSSDASDPPESTDAPEIGENTEGPAQTAAAPSEDETEELLSPTETE